MNPRTQVLLLDVDGVLIDMPDFYCSRFPEVEVRHFFTTGFQAASTGKSDLFKHLPAFMARIGRAGEAADFYREWLEYENRPNKAMLEAVRGLRAAGWRVYLATNQEQHRTQHLLEQGGLGKVSDGHFASHAVGHRKPDLAYFAAVTARLGLAPQQVIFWDDSTENVEAARAAGWQAQRFTDVPDFQRRMGAL